MLTNLVHGSPVYPRVMACICLAVHAMLLASGAAGMSHATGFSRPASAAAPGDPLGDIVGEGCYDHYQEGDHWPQVVEGVEGVVTCSSNYYYFQPVQPAQPSTAAVPAPLGRIVGNGCLASHSEGDRWAQLVDGMEGEITCSRDLYYFWPVRYSPPLRNPVLDRNTLLCLYGNRAASSMGILGELTLEQAAQRLQDLGAAYDRLNGELGVVPCLDYVYLVANATAPPYSHYTPRQDLFYEALEFASAHDMLFFVDLQLGYRDMATTLNDVLPLLQRSNVHLALDTEFYMAHRGGLPGDTLGSMDASDVNQALHMVQQYVEEHGLPDKIVKVYQFDSIMLTNKDALALDLPRVTVLVNADGVGFGGVAGKLGDYRQYAGEPHGALGIKLFNRWDTPLLTPEQVMALAPMPNEVVYQ